MNNNGTFDISPSVVEGQAEFQIRVHDPKMLDYELRKSVTCDIVAKEIGSGNFTAKAKLTVLLNDVNDNYPEFIQEVFEGSVQENALAGTSVLRVEAIDIDSAPGNKIRYTSLKGEGANNFNLDPETGIITVAGSHNLDAETTPVLEFRVEAADENGAGKKSFATVLITLVDINDESPVFEKEVYEFIVNTERTEFTTTAFIKAIDKDISSPNNEIHYEIVDKVNGLLVDEFTGELRLTEKWGNSELLTLTGRAWDGGIPRLSGVCEIRIYPPETNSRKMTFIVPGTDPDTEAIANTLRAITGAKVTINNVRQYRGYEPDAIDISRSTDTEKCVVEAIVHYSRGNIDVKKIQDILDREYRVTHEKSKVKEAESGSLLWLLLLLIFLLLLLALILLCCCLWDRCPYYATFNKSRRVRSAETIRILAENTGHGHESKSVQVAEWFGRKEAWSPELATLDAESLRRHEMERGSERSRVQFQSQPQANEYYVREGNADILRLYTSKENASLRRPITLVPEHTYLPDSGKDILMRRFMENQEFNASKQQENLPNAAVAKLKSENEVLEASLRQQNALLKQILQERERDLKLETQSLPAGTQTDQDACTQTDPHLLLPPKRKVQSNDEQSDDSDEYLASIKEKVKRRNGFRSERIRNKRRIRTPIQEESEIEIIDDQVLESDDNSPIEYNKVRPTRSNNLRHNISDRRRTQSGIRREVLREIADSFYRQEHDRDSREEDIRREILQNVSSAIKHRYRSNSETRTSRSDIQKDIRKDSSNSLRRQSRTASESRLNRTDAETDIIREILNNLHPFIAGQQNQPPVTKENETREIHQLSSLSNTRKINMHELLALSKGMNRSASETRISDYDDHRDLLEGITNIVNDNHVDQGFPNNSAPSNGRTLHGSESHLTSMNNEILQKILVLLNHSNKEGESNETGLEKESSKQVAKALKNSKKRSSSESHITHSDLKSEIVEKLSATLSQKRHSLSDDDGYSDDSLEESPNSDETKKSGGRNRYNSELDLRMPKEQSEVLSKKAKSQTDLSKKREKYRTEQTKNRQ
ncbi:hypothetical protein HHI36_016882 [Cryptolaemus montrouzieri]|uniref:Cadherin domain-containing protein n=1 Tax=Cryptolaemus montrouzieri TaxID=559131 RepID=A0ABD2NLQ8_9CUCU